MRAALGWAGSAADTCDIPIGAVVVGPDGALLAGAANACEALGDPTAHAEMLALRSAASALGTANLTGCVLAVTVEPCIMCAGAIVLSRVRRVIFGCWEPKTGAAGSLWDVLRDRRLNHRVEVTGGMLAAECSSLLVDFFAARRPAPGDTA